MRIRVRKRLGGVIDGVALSQFVPGRIYEVTTSLGGYLTEIGMARPDVSTAPALVVPRREGDVDEASHLLGGVTVSAPQDRAADRPRLRRRRKRR